MTTTTPSIQGTCRSAELLHVYQYTHSLRTARACRLLSAERRHQWPTLQVLLYCRYGCRWLRAPKNAGVDLKGRMQSLLHHPQDWIYRLHALQVEQSWLAPRCCQCNSHSWLSMELCCSTHSSKFKQLLEGSTSVKMDWQVQESLNDLQ